MLISTLIFWFIALFTLAGALGVVAAKNILHAAISLSMTLFGVAAVYIFLQADFVAAVQLIVYVGGILVLIMFAVMFSSHVAEDSTENARGRLAVAAGGLVALAIFSAIILLTQRLAVPLAKANTFGDHPYVNTVSVTAGTAGIGHLLLGAYLLPFEAVSVLLLAALVGAVVIVRKELS